jgi:hypothetical protein
LNENPEALAIWADGHSFKALVVLAALGWVGGRRRLGQIINWGVVRGEAATALDYQMVWM